MTKIDVKKHAAAASGLQKAALKKANKEMMHWHKRHCGHKGANPLVTVGVLTLGVVLGVVVTKFVLKKEEEPEKDEGFTPADGK